MSEPQYRVAIIGSGGIAETHAQYYARNPRTGIIAVADINAEALRQFGDRHEIPARYADHRELLRQEKPDIVSVATWTGTHAAITGDLARAGTRAVLCEKPMAVNLGDARGMVEACEGAGTKLVIHHQRRFVPAWAAAREQIAAGAIGEPTLIPWRFGGGLLNMASHAVDVSLFALGEPSVRWVIGQVERRTNRYERGVPVEDRCAAIIATEGGARIVIESDIAGERGRPDQFIYGTEGTLRIGRQSIHRLAPGVSDWQPIPTQTQGNTLDELLAWLEGGPEHRNAGRYALAAHETLMALYESARTRGVVHLPLQNPHSALLQMIADGTLSSEEPPRDIRSEAALDYATSQQTAG